MGESTTRDGLSRRDLIKRSAVAGAVVWAAPVLDSSAAWGSTPTDCNECNGLTLYSKYAPGNSNTVGNQCLAPCPPVTVISGAVATQCGLISVDDTVKSGENRADISFSSQVRLIRTSIKSTNDCYVTTCVDNFCSVRQYTPSTNPPCNTEATQGTPLAGPLTPPLFEFFAPNTTTSCGSAPTGTPCGCASEVRRVKYNTDGVGRNGTPLNFVEILLCLKGTSVLPPGCA